MVRQRKRFCRMTPFERKGIPWLIATTIVTLLLMLGLVLVGRWITSNFRYPSRSTHHPASPPPLELRSATEEALQLLEDKFLKVDKTLKTLRMIDEGKA